MAKGIESKIGIDIINTVIAYFVFHLLKPTTILRTSLANTTIPAMMRMYPEYISKSWLLKNWGNPMSAKIYSSWANKTVNNTDAARR